MNRYSEAKEVMEWVDPYEIDDTTKATILNALEIANRIENVDIDKAIKKFCAEKKMGECDAICSFCFGGDIFREGYNAALADIRGDNNDVI